MEEKVKHNVPEELVEHEDLQILLFSVRQLGTLCTTCHKEFKFDMSTLKHEELGHIRCNECCVFHYCSDQCSQNGLVFNEPKAQATCKEITEKKAK